MRKTFLTAALLAAAPFAASAADLPMSYTYVEAGWTQINMDESGLNDPKPAGGYVRGSWLIAEQTYVFGSYGQVSYSHYYSYGDTPARLEVELQQPELGIGYRMPWTDRVDFTADVAWIRQTSKVELEYMPDIYTARLKDHTNAGRITAGVRGKPSSKTELWLKAGYIDGSDLDDGEFVGNLGGQVSFTNTIGLVGEVHIYDGAVQSMLGLRVSF